MSPIPERLEIKGDDRERSIGSYVKVMEALVADRGNIIPLAGEEIEFPELPSAQIKKGFRIPFDHLLHNLLPSNSNKLDGLRKYYRQFGIMIRVDWESRVALVKSIGVGREVEVYLEGGKYASRCSEDGRTEGITLTPPHREVVGALLILSPEDFVYASEHGILIGEEVGEKNQVDLVVLPGRQFRELNLELPVNEESLREDRMYPISDMRFNPLASVFRMVEKEIGPLTIFFEPTK